MVHLRSYSVYYSLNESDVLHEYLKPSNIDYNDLNEFVTISNLSQCYAQCVSNTTCKAVKWDKYRSSCSVKFNLNENVKCADDSICLTVPEYHNEAKIFNHLVNIKYCYMVQVWTVNGYSGVKSNQACFKCKVNLLNETNSME